MKRPVGLKPASRIVVTALEEDCPECGARLDISQHRTRWIDRLDGYFHVVQRDKKCRAKGCAGRRPIFRAPSDLRLALPRRSYGLDVTLAVGERHLRGESLRQVQRDLNARGIAVDQRHTGRVFRDFLAVSSVAAGDEETRRQAFRKQGGIVLMCDGVQFDNRAPVLYLAWDAISGTPLFGERKAFRSADDLKPILERVKAMDVPLIAIVSDKEKGLFPAVEAVFPDVPYQLCQAHFLKNCAKPLQRDLAKLAASVTRRATRVHRIAKRLHDANRAEPDHAAPRLEDKPSESAPAPAAAATDIAKEVCLLARQNARVSGRTLTEPAELKRHVRLEEVRRLVDDARSKRGRCRRSSATPSIGLPRHLRRIGTKLGPPAE